MKRQLSLPAYTVGSVLDVGKLRFNDDNAFATVSTTFDPAELALH